MGSDSAAYPGFDDSAAMIFLHQDLTDLLAGLGIISMYHADDLLIQLHAAFAHQLYAALQGFMPSPHLLEGYQRTLVIDLDDRLYIQDAAQHCGGTA